MFWHVIDGTRRKVLDVMLEDMPVHEAYLAGGTALALQLGHRESIDFDWFTPMSFEPGDVEADLRNKGVLEVTESKRNTFHGILDRVQITFLRYPYPLLEPLTVPKENPAFRLASMEDIGAMKMIAVSQRGARKDFVDLYALHRAGISLKTMLGRLPEKFPQNKINLYHIVKSLNFFEDAEEEPMPRMLKHWHWEEMKSFFLENQNELVEYIS